MASWSTSICAPMSSLIYLHLVKLKGGGALAHEPPPTLRHCLKASVQLKKLVRAQQFSMLFVMISHYYFMISV